MDTDLKRNIRTMARLKDLWESNIVANKQYIKQDIRMLYQALPLGGQTQ